MIDKDRTIVPYPIKQARISRGLSMLELSDHIEVTKQAVSQYEMGKNTPSNLVMNKISNTLKYPISFFYKPLPINQVANSPIFFRSKKTSKVKSRSAAREKIELFREINDYLSTYIDFPETNMPKIDYNEDVDGEDIENYSRKLREFWGLGTGPIDNLMNTVQKNGIMVTKMLLGMNKIDAFSVWYSGMPFVFLSGDKDTNVRLRFDIAHEIGHLLMHSEYYTEEDLKKSDINQKVEDEANRFAGAFLLPEEAFSKDVYSSSIDHFIQLKSKWKVSIAAMIYRCEDLGLLSQNQIKYLKDQMTSRMYWRKEPLDNTMKIEKPFAHKQAISLLLEGNYITPSKMSEDLGFYPEEIEEYCFLDKGTLSEVKNDNVIKLKAR